MSLRAAAGVASYGFPERPEQSFTPRHADESQHPFCATPVMRRLLADWKREHGAFGDRADREGIPHEGSAEWILTFVRMTAKDADQRGLTLVEMLVVLAIIGISTAAAVLALGAGHDGSGQAEAQRLVARVQLAADEAMISDRALALSVTPTGYAVLERHDVGTAWQPTTLSGLDDVHHLPAGMQLVAPPAGAVLPLDADAGRPFAVTLNRGAQHWKVSFDGMRARLAPGAKAAS